MAFNAEKYLQLTEKTYFKQLGKVVKIVGLTIESVGPDAKINDLCRIVIDQSKGIYTMAEVVGFRDKRLLLMPFEGDRKSTRLNSSHRSQSRMPSSA